MTVSVVAAEAPAARLSASVEPLVTPFDPSVLASFVSAAPPNESVWSAAATDVVAASLCLIVRSVSVAAAARRTGEPKAVLSDPGKLTRMLHSPAGGSGSSDTSSAVPRTSQAPALHPAAVPRTCLTSSARSNGAALPVLYATLTVTVHPAYIRPGGAGGGAEPKHIIAEP